MTEQRKEEQERLTVFLSYSRKDSVFADWLVSALEARGLEVLIDRRDLPLATEFMKELLGFIRQADSVIYVASNASIQSPWCAWEVEQVQLLNKRLAPVVIEDIANANVPEGIRKINYVYFTGQHHSEQGFERQADALARALLTDVEWIKVHTRIGERARLWDERGRKSAMLLRGIEIEDAEDWSAKRPLEAPALTDLQREFMGSSRHSATRSQRRWLAGALAVAAMAVSLSVLAYTQRNAARDQRDTALLNQSRYLADQSGRALTGGDASRALAIALEAMPHNIDDPERPVLPEAHDALSAALVGLNEGPSLSQAGPDRARKIVFSPDMSRIADVPILDPGSIPGPTLRDTTIPIRETATGRMIAMLAGHGGAILRLAFSKDGERIVTAGEDGTLRSWSVKSGSENSRTQFVPVAKGSVDGGAPPAAREGSSQRPDLDDVGDVNVTISPDAQTAVIWRKGETAKLVHLDAPDKSVELPVKLLGLGGDPAFIALSDGSAPLFSADETLLRLDDGAQQHLLSIDAGGARVIASADKIILSPAGGHYLVCSGSTPPALWDVTKTEAVKSLDGGCSGDSDAAFSPDGTYVAVKKAEAALLYSCFDGELQRTLNGPGSDVMQLRFSPQGNYLKIRTYASGAASPNLAVFHIASDNAERLHPDLARDAETVIFSPDDHKIAVLSRTGSVLLADLIGGSSEPTRLQPAERIRDIHGISTDKQWLYSSDALATRSWRITSGSPLDLAASAGAKVLEILPGEARAIRVSQSNLELIELSDGTVTHRIEAGALVQRQSKEARAPQIDTAVMSSDKSTIAVLASIDVEATGGERYVRHVAVHVLSSDLRARSVQLELPRSDLVHLRFSADGTRLLGRGKSGLQVWDVSSGKAVGALDQLDLSDAVPSRNGSRAILITEVGSFEREAKIWTVGASQVPTDLLGTGRGRDELGTLPLPGGRMISLSTDGREIHITTLDGARTLARLASTGQKLDRLHIGPGLMGAGQRYVLATGYGKNIVLDLASTPDAGTTAKEPAALAPAALESCEAFLENFTPQIVLSDDGSRMFAVASSAEPIVVLDAASASCPAPLSGIGEPVKQFAVDAQGRIAIASLETGSGGLLEPDRSTRLAIWRIDEPSKPIIVDLKQNILAAAISPDGSKIALALSGGTIRFLNPAGEISSEIPAPVARPVGVSFLPDGQRLAIHGKEGKLVLLDLATGQAAWERAVAAFDADMSIAAEGRLILIRETETLTVLRSADGSDVLTAKVGESVGAHIGGDGQHLVVSLSSGGVLLWYLATGQQSTYRAGAAPDSGGLVESVQLAPDGASIIAVSNGRLRVWDTATIQSRTLYEPPSGDIIGARHSPDGGAIAVITEAGAALLIDAQTGAVKSELGHKTDDLGSNLKALAFSQDGTAFAAATDKLAVVWRLADPQKPLMKRFKNLDVGQLAWSPDGDTLAIARCDSDDCTVTLWDLVSDQVTHSRRLEKGYLGTIGFSPDGRYVTATTLDKAFAWEAPSDWRELVARACRHLPRVLSANERKGLFLDERPAVATCGRTPAAEPASTDR